LPLSFLTDRIPTTNDGQKNSHILRTKKKYKRKKQKKFVQKIKKKTRTKKSFLIHREKLFFMSFFLVSSQFDNAESKFGNGFGAKLLQYWRKSIETLSFFRSNFCSSFGIRSVNLKKILLKKFTSLERRQKNRKETKTSGYLLSIDNEKA